ncbi:MAG: TlpA family protein disulfide reductase [Bacteroidetes bacterium]|nr:TlpA family protein disulfide reductase [Bacteroidota bacterium]
MSPGILLILRLAVGGILLYQLGSMVQRGYARRWAIPRDAREWRSLGGGVMSLLIAAWALLTLQRNYQRPMDLLEAVSRTDIHSVEFRDSRTGQNHHLSEWQGQWVILNIWATWCPPCRREMPGLENVHRMASRHGTAVIALSDEVPATVEAYLQENLMSLPVGTFTAMPDILADIQTRPVSILIAPDGRIVDRVVGARGQTFFQKWAEDHPASPQKK